MTLYFIGIGLCDEKDITVKGLEAIRKCEAVYLESYTSRLQCSADDLGKSYGKKIIMAGRDMVESRAEETILKDAKEKETAFLVIGDPFGATTHTDLRMRALKMGIKVKVIHNASIINAVGETGLELYKFGRTTSIPFDNENIKAPLEVLAVNRKNGLHTLFLLDLRPEESRYMTVNEALDYLMKNGLGPSQPCIGIAALGSEGQQTRFGKAGDIAKEEFTRFPQCLVVPGELHFVEEEALMKYS